MDKNIPLLNSTIVRKLFIDTKQNKINWFRPYESQKDFLTAYIYLKKPEHSHLKFVLKRPVNELELVVFYVRKKGFEDYETKEVRKITNDTLSLLLRVIEEQLRWHDFMTPQPPKFDKNDPKLLPPRLDRDDEIPY